MRALLLLLSLAGCVLFEPLPPAEPVALSPAERAIILEWALSGDRPRDEPIVVSPDYYPREPFWFGYKTGDTWTLVPF